MSKTSDASYRRTLDCTILECLMQFIYCFLEAIGRNIFAGRAQKVDFDIPGSQGHFISRVAPGEDQTWSANIATGELPVKPT